MSRASTKSTSRPKIVYVTSQELVRVSSRRRSNKKRPSLVHSLIKDLGLLSNQSISENWHRIHLISPRRATKEELRYYYTERRTNFVLNATKCYGPLLVGATLSAVDQLTFNLADVALCWEGGRRIIGYDKDRYCAQKTHVPRFYVADCILAIYAFKNIDIPAPTGPPRKSRTLYLDLDPCFSNAVMRRFYKSGGYRFSPQVLTFSVHFETPGSFPPTPHSGLSDPLSDDFDPFSLSLPLRQGASAATYARLWPIIEDVKNAFNPDFVIVQCGVDDLAGDPCGIFNWSIDHKDGDLAWCVSQIVNNWNCKTLVLGGGGYNAPNAARAWAHVTSAAVNDFRRMRLISLTYVIF